MATTPVWIEGFETGKVYRDGSGVAVSATGKRTGDYGLVVTKSGAGTAYEIEKTWGAGAAASFNLATAFVRVFVRVATRPGSTSEELIGSLNTTGTAYKFIIRITSDGNLAVYQTDATTLVATGTTVLATDTWYRIEFVVRDSTSGAYEVKINGTTELSGSGYNFGASNFGMMTFGAVNNRNGQSYTAYFDDARIDTDDFPGDGSILRIDASATGQDTAWDSSAGGAQVIADMMAVPWSGTPARYATTSTGSESTTYDLEDCATVGISGTVKAVLSHLLAQGGAGNGSFCVRTRGSGTNVNNTANVTLNNGAWYLLGAFYAADPGGSDALTTAIIDAMEVGSTSNTGECRIGGICAQVEWLAGASGGSFLIHTGLGGGIKDLAGGLRG